eukprot:TRINITY_DN14830_c0_g1_i1.p2 TRINITY_DN14830_c0_g1~~TRINITY_DN14830_c0_g1_i1.p2  ORF type:complete len:265 (+),score=89.63 TRINITY_DN14830_c0_g1_i1:56-796(+)
MAFPKGSSKHKLGDWQCHVERFSDEVKHCIVIMHGFGASNSDFIPFAQMMKSTLGQDVLWVFPQANEEPAAWWSIDVGEWLMANMQMRMGKSDALAPLIRKEFEGIPSCRNSGEQLVGAILAACPSLTHDRIHLAGFSQGAMTAMDLALHLPTTVGSVAMFSGAPIMVDKWAERLQGPHAQKMKVFISHGRMDEVLPFAGSEWSKQLLEQRGQAQVTYVPHGGGHDLGGQEVMSQLTGFWKSHTSR